MLQEQLDETTAKMLLYRKYAQPLLNEALKNEALAMQCDLECLVQSLPNKECPACLRLKKKAVDGWKGNPFADVEAVLTLKCEACK